MAVFKCKMCGGQLDIQEDQTVIECEYCGSKQTIPVLDDEKKISLFSRANKLRAACDFDKAFSVYESIVAEYENEAEGYWGLILCKYGIEYVDDPNTGKKIPTCHRTSFDSVMDDPNFDLVMENADGVARKVYRDEAKQIESLRTKIIEISSNEDPYDIFICYKETAEDGNRTIDSVIAQDVYTELTNKGYKVFFSRITLEDKLGQEYEPYIFSALNSAKLMLVFGTDYEYFNAVWVKNEWSRYLKLMSSGQKKTLIPCYKDIDAYDMPKEFKHLQAQDMGKVGATQDLLRGIEKIIPLKKEEKVIQQTVVTQSAEEPLLKRVFMFLEGKQWKEADTYCEKVLDINPECAKAYLGKLMVDLKVNICSELSNCQLPFNNNRNYQMALRFADDNLKKELEDYNKVICERNERKKREKELDDARILYRSASKKMNAAKTDNDFLETAKLFENISFFQDSKELMNECLQKANEIKFAKENRKNTIKSLMNEYKLLYESDKDGVRIQEVKAKLCEFNVGKQFVNSYEYLKANIGDTVLFGEYEQSLNKKEKVEWIILDKVDNKVLIISKYALDCQQYNTENKAYGSLAYTWENSDIRKWLNNNFLNTTFNEDEKLLVLNTQLQEKYDGKIYGSSSVTVDKVFLLTKNEVDKYFNSEEEKKCLPTKYAKYRGVKLFLFSKYCVWWLRDVFTAKNTSNTFEYYAKDIYIDGKPNYMIVNYRGLGVRPCLWLGVDTNQID